MHLGPNAKLLQQGIWRGDKETWARIDFEVQTRGNDATNETVVVAGANQIGFYLLQKKPWGRLEVLAEKQLAGVSANWSGQLRNSIKIATSIRFTQPQTQTIDRTKLPPELSDATPILGLWKSSRSLVHLGQDGAIRIVADEPFEREANAGDSPNLHEKSKEGMARHETPLVGHFTARDDLMFTTWGDGSKLNYRWRMHMGDLLLTDSQGRTSKLFRIPCDQ